MKGKKKNRLLALLVVLCMAGGCSSTDTNTTTASTTEATTQATTQATTVATTQATTEATTVATTQATTEKQAVVLTGTDDTVVIKQAQTNGKVVSAEGRQKEVLDRGVVAAKAEKGNFVSWRLLESDADTTYFNLYRDGVKIKTTGNTSFTDEEGTSSSKYYVESVVDGKVTDKSKEITAWAEEYLSIKLDVPANGVTPTGEEYYYKANDATVADVDGDGEFEIVLKWDPSNSQDNSKEGYTGNVYIDAYKLDGTKLWRIDLGKNIRAGAHYTQFVAYDFDGDGKAELAVKTADGTVDGQGNVIGDADADWRDDGSKNKKLLGRILTGPEYLTVFDGATGKALDTIDFEVGRGTLSSWGDTYGNRIDRFLSCAAYLDGKTPSFVMCRGYYARTTLTAYNFVNGKIEKLWQYDTNVDGKTTEAGKLTTGQGNHGLTVLDVDNDGCDEIIYGALTMDNDGKPLYSTGFGHGDAMHVSDIDPSRDGYEVFSVHESKVKYNDISAYWIELHDAATGEVLWAVPMDGDVGRGVSADIDPSSPGMESWSASKVSVTDMENGFVQGVSAGLISADGKKIGDAPSSKNFTLLWDGDLLSELLDGSEGKTTPYIWKYKDMDNNLLKKNIKTFTGMEVNNSTKGTPTFSGDILGDWREEVILRSKDNTELRIYTTTIPTEYRMTTLLQDDEYRMALVWQNTAYNQPPHTSYYIGSDMEVTVTEVKVK